MISIRTVAAAALVAILGALPASASAASIDLLAIGQRLGAVLLPETPVDVVFDRADNGVGGFNDFFFAADAPFDVFIEADASDPSTATLSLASPFYSGTVVDIAFGLDMVEALFVDASGDLVLARGFGFDPELTGFPGEGDFLAFGATLTVIDVALIPLPGGLALALAGVGGLLLVGRRSRA